jgi:DNA repair exonuclease SbcCD ATPase subunit
VEGFGPKGLKNYILDTKLQAITDAANHWVQLLTGGTIWVRIETQTLARSTGSLRNKINVRVFRHMPDGNIRERNYRSWSGGEKQRVSLGIDLGLSSLIASRSRKKYDILILDELFRHLDGAGREAVMELLHALKREKSSVFVIDHDSEFQAQFERRLVIHKLNGKSTITTTEATNDRGTGTEEASAQPRAAAQDDHVPAAKPRPRRTPVAGG